jgi:hypothetical protein
MCRAPANTPVRQRTTVSRYSRQEGVSLNAPPAPSLAALCFVLLGRYELRIEARVFSFHFHFPPLTTHNGSSGRAMADYRAPSDARLPAAAAHDRPLTSGLKRPQPPRLEAQASKAARPRRNSQRHHLFISYFFAALYREWQQDTCDIHMLTRVPCTCCHSLSTRLNFFPHLTITSIKSKREHMCHMSS